MWFVFILLFLFWFFLPFFFPLLFLEEKSSTVAYTTENKSVPIYKLLSGFKPFFGQRTLKMQTAWIRNAGGQNPGWVSRNYTAVLWVIIEHFMPMLSALKNKEQNDTYRFPTQPSCSFSKAIKCFF